MQITVSTYELIEIVWKPKFSVKICGRAFVLNEFVKKFVVLAAVFNLSL